MSNSRDTTQLTGSMTDPGPAAGGPKQVVVGDRTSNKILKSQQILKTRDTRCQETTKDKTKKEKRV